MNSNADLKNPVGSGLFPMPVRSLLLRSKTTKEKLRFVVDINPVTACTRIDFHLLIADESDLILPTELIKVCGNCLISTKKCKFCTCYKLALYVD